MFFACIDGLGWLVGEGRDKGWRHCDITAGCGRSDSRLPHVYACQNTLTTGNTTYGTLRRDALHLLGGVEAGVELKGEGCLRVRHVVGEESLLLFHKLGWGG